MREIYKINITSINSEAIDDKSLTLPLIYFDKGTKSVVNQLAFLGLKNIEINKKEVLSILTPNLHPKSTILSNFSEESINSLTTNQSNEINNDKKA
jgi:hypothetical protein